MRTNPEKGGEHVAPKVRAAVAPDDVLLSAAVVWLAGTVNEGIAACLMGRVGVCCQVLDPMGMQWQWRCQAPQPAPSSRNAPVYYVHCQIAKKQTSSTEKSNVGAKVPWFQDFKL